MNESDAIIDPITRRSRHTDHHEGVDVPASGQARLDDRSQVMVVPTGPTT